MAIFFDAPVAPDDLTTFVREVPADSSLALSQMFPTRFVDDNTVDFAEIISGIGAAQRPEVRRQIEASGLSADAGLAMSLSAEGEVWAMRGQRAEMGLNVNESYLI